MNMPLKPSIPAASALLGAQPLKDAVQTLGAGAMKSVIGKGVEALGAVQLRSLAAFDELAGMPQRHGPSAHQPQSSVAVPGQRGGIPARPAVRPRTQATRQTPADSRWEPDEDNVLEREARNILKRICNEDQSGAEQNLDDYDPLRRYRLLQEALKQLEGEPSSDGDKAAPRSQIRRLLGDLDKQHGRDIREGLEATGDMHALLQSLGNASINAVRGWFGTTAQGRVHAPLTPIDLAIRLKTTFGAAQFSAALSRLGQTVARRLSARNHRVAGEPPLMALSDTRAFTMVRSCHAKAQELMRELADINITVRERRGPMDVAIMLMMMAAGGKEQAVNLAGNIIDWQSLPTRRRSRAWAILRKVVSELPLALWPQDAGVRAAVLADFGDRLKEQDAMLPRAAVTEASKREAELRERHAKRTTAAGHDRT